ncbi:hypothetical protein IT072_13880 [Leifsonia sp. ZF2019]|uniref:hypothetical protein n=1 Tax=Leifsonia sp. ZF2019 TaxID=2781978 RepID=UPI001CBA862F|nr:hypothetical protein [Leifsonia sp. ZF2019]UAJ78347.1 hypothetical protein IT072_13880 [Leifsonia sp. ZF2019]
MSTALNVWSIEYSGPLVRIDKHNLPDLDDLLLDILAHPETQSELRWHWVESDPATALHSRGGEAHVGYFRKNPCACGDNHTFDLGEVGMDEDGNPVGRAARGAFMGVYFVD